MDLRPTFYERWTAADPDAALQALESIPWVDVAGNRFECFMASDLSKTYSYGKGAGRRIYHPEPFHPLVSAIMEELNTRLPASFNVCVLNRYPDERHHLGWHADDSPEQDPAHPIAVVSFGAAREIWTKRIGATGHVPPEDRFLLTPGSLFLMPAFFQDHYLHRIPKPGARCGLRTSLTFRKLDR